MSIASLNVVPEDMRTSVVRIHSYQDKNPQGTFYNPYYGEAIPFANLTRLLLLMDDMMNELDCPQVSVRSRRFVTTPKPVERASLPKGLRQSDEQAIATFYVKVLFRQGASWQGKLRWADEAREVPFRSALELIKLMDSALPQPEPCRKETISEAADAG